MRDRGLLHFNQLPALIEWAKRQGWKQVETKGDFEVLRLRRDRQCAIFHRKSEAREHLTVWGDSERLTKDFLRYYKPPQQAAAQ
jgi:hypothetical protein